MTKSHGEEQHTGEGRISDREGRRGKRREEDEGENKKKQNT